MPQKALVVFDRCHPELCSKEGICAAAQACPRKLLKQEAPYQIPLPDPSICQACVECVRACPLKAIIITRV
ncbi:MAG: 4Fe-4S ferredoxin [Dehalococcoidia bacterium]|nr:4Fe-4S ferredoxin [Dehalococcoidia bacterium]